MNAPTAQGVNMQLLHATKIGDLYASPNALRQTQRFYKEWQCRLVQHLRE